MSPLQGQSELMRERQASGRAYLMLVVIYFKQGVCEFFFSCSDVMGEEEEEQHNQIKCQIDK